MFNANLTRIHYLSSGIFSVLEIGGVKFYCASHAYLNNLGVYCPKVPCGIYLCQRHPPEKLPYETFEIMEVPEFQNEQVTGILFHILNWPQTESEGCEGVGSSIDLDAPKPMITKSEESFKKFMDLLSGYASFQLTVK